MTASRHEGHTQGANALEGTGRRRGMEKIKASRRQGRGVRHTDMTRVGAEDGLWRVGGVAGTWCASSGCQRGLFGGARALRSALTASRGGSMLREGTDPSVPRGNHPSVHRGGYTPGYTVEARRRRSLQPALRRSTLNVLLLRRPERSPPFPASSSSLRFVLLSVCLSAAAAVAVATTPDEGAAAAAAAAAAALPRPGIPIIHLSQITWTTVYASQSVLCEQPGFR